MDKMEILFKEYETLRTENISRYSSAYQSAAPGSLFAAALLTWAWAYHPRLRLVIPAVSVYIVLLIIFYGKLYANVMRVAERIRELEGQINQLAGGENLLQWETRCVGRARLWTFLKKLAKKPRSVDAVGESKKS